MIVTITASYRNGDVLFVDVNEISECPICKHAIQPVQLNARAFDTSNGEKKLSVDYLCKACDNSFIIQYEDLRESSAVINNKKYSSDDCSYIAPYHFLEEKFDKLIQNTSSSFVKIYNQALAAQSYDLDEIAGIGYRKALEFLIKDFLISRAPDKKESIEKALLGNCINNFIDNQQLKTAASRAAWLGNDQTHYIQKFEDKDINDLKRLIRLTVHWISMILETEEAEKIEPIK